MEYGWLLWIFAARSQFAPLEAHWNQSNLKRFILVIEKENEVQGFSPKKRKKCFVFDVAYFPMGW